MQHFRCIVYKETRNVWHSLVYSPFGTVVSPPCEILMKHTYLLIDTLSSSPALYWMYLKSPQKHFRCQLYNFLCLNSGVTEPNPTEFLQAVQKWLELTLPIHFSTPTWRMKIVVKLRANHGKKSFNSVKSDIVGWGWTFTKFVHNLAGLLPFNVFKADLWSANPLSNAEFWETGVRKSTIKKYK